MFQGIDLISDTVTRPTTAMKKAMMDAEVGDEQKGEDPTTCRLEEMIADILGHTTAMFFPSATMANEVAIRTLCEPGDELLAAETCHLFHAEAGGPAIHSGVMARPIHTENGVFTGEHIRHVYRWSTGPHYPRSKLVSVENTTNMGGGIAWPAEILDSIFLATHALGLKTHLDGARLFNASIRTSLSPEKIANRFDTVTVCFSKGLGCPMGAVLAFDKIYYEKIRRLKQLMGGAMRQSGMLAAAAIYALRYHIERLNEDHENAQLLAEKLSDGIAQIHVENNPPSTNMVFFSWNSSHITSTQFLEQCIKHGLRFSQTGQNRFRAVTHLDIQKENIVDAVSIVRKICNNI